MQVTPFRTHLSQDCKVIYEALETRQRHCRQAKTPQLVSFSLEIPAVDPLVVFSQYCDSHQHFFYWEQRSQGLSIAALQPEKTIQVHVNRFEQIQGFIDQILDNADCSIQCDSPFAGPHFFCGFTFFEPEPLTASTFPSGLAFLPRYQVVRHQDQGILVVNIYLNSESDVDALILDLKQLLSTIKRLPKHYRPWQSPPPMEWVPQRGLSSTRLEASIQSTLDLIAQKKLQKLVLAHPLDVRTTAPLDMGYTLNRLRRHYPDCHVFAISNADGKVFFGASPERLVQLRDRHLVTDVLAGSAPRGQSVVDDLSLGKHLLNNRKDAHEHQLVLEFICNQLRQLGMEPKTSSPAQLMQLPNIQHLRTLVNAEIPADLHLLEILAALHPTPAVAGTDRDRACQYIRQYEAFERHLYAAPLGWINHRGDGEFAVGIRSALNHGCHTRFYAGAGIVAGSDPKKELAEVELKLQTLLEALV